MRKFTSAIQDIASDMVGKPLGGGVARTDIASRALSLGETRSRYLTLAKDTKKVGYILWICQLSSTCQVSMSSQTCARDFIVPHPEGLRHISGRYCSGGERCRTGVVVWDGRVVWDGSDDVERTPCASLWLGGKRN